MFTARHYKKIAEIFDGLSVVECASGPGKLQDIWFHALTVVDCFCDLFEEDNPKFNKRLFIKKCGFEPWDKLIMGRPFNKDEL